MKKYSWLLLLVIAGSLFSASIPSASISYFLGARLGDKAAVVDRILKSRGFTFMRELKQTAASMYLYSGRAISYDSSVVVGMFHRGQLFRFGVSVETSYENYMDRYNRLLTLLTKKYGSPERVWENFSTPYAKGDGYEYQAIRMGKCQIGAQWIDAKGNWIKLSIQSGSCRIMVMYVFDKLDKLWIKAKAAKDSSDL